LLFRVQWVGRGPAAGGMGNPSELKCEDRGSLSRLAPGGNRGVVWV